ncbi:protein Daple isoform X2 [Gadus morhua]|uniref:protein Daple isoform X2 n=1 Tax=Gadus morhua TaxID=8049 RepID=UPI0011B59F8F|nr:protein Daple-like isoform X2 [Gadus morhua]
MDLTLSELLVQFMESPLVVWIQTLGPLGSPDGVSSEERVNLFMELVDGVFLHKIMTQIDPSPTNQRLNKNVNNDVSLRLYNLTVLTRQIRSYYQETLRQLIVMTLPDVLCIAKDPLSAKSMEEMKRMLLLILGCAVQCERKEEMIEKIKLLDIQTQAAIVSHIQEVTHNQLNVLDLSWLEEGAELTPDDLDPLSRNMAVSLRQLIEQREKANEVILDLTQERDFLSSQQPRDGYRSLGVHSPEQRLHSGGLVGANGGPVMSGPEHTKEEKHHLSVELADNKAKLRRFRQELEEKTEQLMDSKHEAERLNQELQRLRQENQSLSTEARFVRAYQDEMDSMKERAARVDRLEAELTRCKEKLNDVHFYKSRVEELRGDNLTLMETKVLLEDQLSASRGRCEKLHAVEKDNLLMRAKIHDVEMERDSERRRLEELVEENMLLEIGQKQSMNESAHLGWELEQLAKNHDNTETRKSLIHELNEGVSSRLLKLEKENRELQDSIEKLREEKNQLQGQLLSTQELERENQGLGKKLESLQGMVDQERLTNQDMESLGEELLKEKQTLERELQVLRAEKDRQMSELEHERQHLSEAVTSLRERAQANSEACVREVEAENRQLHQALTDVGSQLASLESQLKLANEEAVCLQEKARRCEEVEREAVRLEQCRDGLNRELASLLSSKERAEALEKEVASLEQESRRLKREAEEVARLGAQRTVRREEESRLLAQENRELRRSSEGLRSAAARLAALQEEHSRVQQEHEELAGRLEEAREESRVERRQAEQTAAALSQEKRRLEEALERTQDEKEEAERTRQEEREARRREAGELREERRRREEAEEERRRIVTDLEQSEKERKGMEKETWRLRNQLEAKEAELEEKEACLTKARKESGAQGKELERLKEASVRVKELERDSKELQKQATIDLRTLATLREELVSEKLNGQQQNLELESLNQELEKVGLNRERLLQQEHSLEDSKYRLLESRLEETVQQTMKLKEQKISSLKQKLQESNTLNTTLRSELTSTRQTVSSLRQEKEENCNQNLLPRTVGQSQIQVSATAELLRVKDHLIDLEKNNSSLQTESSLLKEQLKQLDNQNSSLNSQMAAQQRHTVLLQEQNTSLHTQTARLQVENSTLSSQSASLMAQNAVLQGQVVALETEVESWHRQRDEAWQGRENVLSDHERLLNVHERQAHEYEQLISQHASLKVKQRALEGEHRALHNKYCSLLQHKEKWEAQEGRGQKEKEELNQEVENNRLLQQESLQLKAEVDRMTQSQSQHNAEIEGLQHRNNELKSLLSSAKTETSQCMKQYDSLMEQHRVVDLSKVKLDNHCELLSRLKGNLEEENHHLLSQISLLSQQNHALLERSMESKELYHAEQKLYIDKLNALRRHKEKLEEKIMDQYKFHDPTPKKRSHWSGAKALAKLIKPRKESGSRDKDEDWERARSAPDIPLPSPPPLLLPNDDHPPPLPPRMGSDTPDNGSQVFNQHSSPVLMSPALTPGGRGLSDRGRGLYRNSTPGGSNENVTEEEGQDSILGHRGHLNGRPGSIDLSHNTSGSNSPVYYRETSDRHCRSSSLSSDDVMALSKSQPSLSRSSTLPYDHTPQRAQPQRGTSGFRAKPPRSSSPGSEMVSLEQFLQESNIQSPPTVSTGSKEDLMADYFTRSPALSAPAEREQALPTHYVTPTVQPGNQRPGQNVKPFPRLPVGQTPSQSPSRAYSQSPSRAYSLASADLLRSNGADVYRADDSPLGQPEVLLRRPGGPTNGSQRPLSACVAGSGSLPGEGGCPTAPLHHSSSFNLQTERYAEREREREREGVPTSISTTSLSYHHRGEVAMVSPVRAVQAPRSDDEPEQREGLREGRAADSSHNDKGGEIARCASAERLDSKPASPDPNNDPQTVWYEYGCV